MTRQDQENNYAMGLMDAVTLLKKYWLHIVLVCVLCGVVGFFGSKFLIAPSYEATATMIVNAGDGGVEVVTNDQITSAEKLVDTYAVIITSRSVLERVIDNLQLDIDYKQLKKKVTVESVNSTQIIGISVCMPSVDGAEQVLAEILDIAPMVILDAVEAGSVKTIDAAAGEEDPVSPNVGLNTIVAVVIGLVISCMYFFLRNALRYRYQDEQEIEEDLDVEVLGSIPKLPG